MANDNGPGIDAAFRQADRAQDEALASLDRVNRGKDAAARQSALDVLRDVEAAAKKGSWIPTTGY
jgi:hypothetical protein